MIKTKRSKINKSKKNVCEHTFFIRDLRKRFANTIATLPRNPPRPYLCMCIYYINHINYKYLTQSYTKRHDWIQQKVTTTSSSMGLRNPSRPRACAKIIFNNNIIVIHIIMNALLLNAIYTYRISYVLLILLLLLSRII